MSLLWVYKTYPFPWTWRYSFNLRESLGASMQTVVRNNEVNCLAQS